VIKVGDLTAHLAERTRPEFAASWDPVGLQLGDPGDRVERVGVCHEITEEVVAAAKKSPVDLLVTYHPLLFSPTNRIIGGRSPEARAYRLIQASVAVLVVHTDFDAAPGGTADALATVFNLRDVEPFGVDFEVGIPAIGRIGEFGQSLGVLEAITTDAFGIAGLRVSGDRDQILGRVAVVPGSGADFIDAAVGHADAIVTGDVSHHRVVHALDRGLAVVDPGHIATERPGMAAFVALVATIPDVEIVDFTDIDPETWG
jgi:dinuclear metal center YbgI/SA1388 family protein